MAPFYLFYISLLRFLRTMFHWNNHILFKIYELKGWGTPSLRKLSIYILEWYFRMHKVKLYFFSRYLKQNKIMQYLHVMHLLDICTRVCPINGNEQLLRFFMCRWFHIVQHVIKPTFKLESLTLSFVVSHFLFFLREMFNKF